MLPASGPPAQCICVLNPALIPRRKQLRRHGSALSSRPPHNGRCCPSTPQAPLLHLSLIMACGLGRKGLPGGQQGGRRTSRAAHPGRCANRAAGSSAAGSWRRCSARTWPPVQRSSGSRRSSPSGAPSNLHFAHCSSFASAWLCQGSSGLWRALAGSGRRRGPQNLARLRLCQRQRLSQAEWSVFEPALGCTAGV